MVHVCGEIYSLSDLAARLPMVYWIKDTDGT